MTHIGLSQIVIAGMPSPQLVVSELGKRRLEEISFFVLSFLLGAVVFRLLWNLLQRDLAWWPRLTYRGTLGLLCVWGCLLTVVLSLISGARELMTPAAWTPNGITHKWATSDNSPAANSITRRERLIRLETVRTLLWKFAAEHDGRFPTGEQEIAEIPEPFWIAVPGTTLKFVYQPGPATPNEDPSLVIEPQYFDDGQFVLRRNGEFVFIERIHSSRSEASP